MGVMASLITSLRIVYSTLYSGADQRKHQSSASLAFVRGIHRGPVNSPHKGPVTRKMLPFDDVIMPTICLASVSESSLLIRLLHIEAEDINIVVMSLILTTICIFFQTIMNNKHPGCPLFEIHCASEVKNIKDYPGTHFFEFSLLIPIWLKICLL